MAPPTMNNTRKRARSSQEGSDNDLSNVESSSSTRRRLDSNASDSIPLALDVIPNDIKRRIQAAEENTDPDVIHVIPRRWLPAQMRASPPRPRAYVTYDEPVQSPYPYEESGDEHSDDDSSMFSEADRTSLQDEDGRHAELDEEEQSANLSENVELRDFSEQHDEAVVTDNEGSIASDTLSEEVLLNEHTVVDRPEETYAYLEDPPRSQASQHADLEQLAQIQSSVASVLSANISFVTDIFEDALEYQEASGPPPSSEATTASFYSASSQLPTEEMDSNVITLEQQQTPHQGDVSRGTNAPWPPPGYLTLAEAAARIAEGARNSTARYIQHSTNPPRVHLVVTEKQRIEWGSILLRSETRKRMRKLAFEFIGEDKRGENCGICLVPRKECKRIAVVQCKHIYCAECILRWVGESIACPMCRTVMERILVAPRRNGELQIERLEEYGVEELIE